MCIDGVETNHFIVYLYNFSYLLLNLLSALIVLFGWSFYISAPRSSNGLFDIFEVEEVDDIFGMFYVYLRVMGSLSSGLSFICLD